MKTLTETDIGNSIYQIESKKYYNELRKIHSAVFISGHKRVAAEKHDERYSNCSAKGIKNLYTFVDILAARLKNVKEVNGIDFGCGSHYLISDLNEFDGWNVIGFDMDKAAIAEAQKNYPEVSDKYFVLNFLKDRLPVEDKSQDFVFCNAVIQHLSTEEMLHAFEDIARVLKKNGVFILIFKRKIKDWEIFLRKTGLQINIINQEEGQIEIEDEEMRKAFGKLKKGEKTKIDPNYLKGMRLLHFFSVEEVIGALEHKGLKIINEINLPGGAISNGIIKYFSGKNIPTAALFSRKV
jgi:SAM-dependent methyltransferase